MRFGVRFLVVLFHARCFLFNRVRASRSCFFRSRFTAARCFTFRFGIR